VAEVVVRGHGWGHGLGMSQYGAQGAARLGCTATDILTTYYRGTTVTARAMAPTVRLTLLQDGTSAAVTAQGGPTTWRDVTRGGTAVQPMGSTWTVVLTTTGHSLRDAAGTQRLWVPDGELLHNEQLGTVARVRTLRGGATVTDLRMRWDYTQLVSSSAGLSVTQVVRDGSEGTAVDKYLWGLAEVPVTWPPAALQAQAVAARTYLARRWDASRSAYVIGTTTSAQHYTGWTHEQEDATYGGRWRAAVGATTGRLVVDAAATPVDTVYSSSHGGWSEDSRYVWGTDTPYLKAVDDSRWDAASDNPYRSWAVGTTAARLAAAFGVDHVTSVTVPPRGSAARLGGLVLNGLDDGRPFSRAYEGWDVRQALGLRSPGIVSITFASPGTPLVGDWDGDGDDDLGWHRAGVFTLRADDGTLSSFRFGSASDVAVVGDWDGVGGDGIGVFRAGQWHLRETATAGPATRVVGFGSRGDRPVVGAWAGGAADGVGIVRGNVWHLRTSATTGPETSRLAFGRASDRVVTGDWDANGSTDPGVERLGTWYLAASVTSPVSRPPVAFGPGTGAVPLGADWDGDGRATPGVVIGDQWRWRDDLAGGPATGAAAFSG
jgi:stage II sporulation protein D